MAYTGPIINPPASGDSPIWQYGYVPSLAMSIVGIIAWFVVAQPHLWWFLKMLGTRSVHGLFFFASIIEVLGFGARLYMHTHEYSGMGFLVAISLVQIGTILMTAALYKSVQRGIKYTPEGRQLSPMRPRSLVTLFTILDVVFVMLQMAGQYFVAAAQAAEATDAEPMFSLGTSGLIFLAGNVLQAVTIIIFSAFVHVILRRSRKMLAGVPADSEVQYPFLKPLFLQILISAGLFLVRLVVRVAQGAQGLYGKAATNEIFFGIFEFLPLVALVALWAARPLYKFIFPLGHRHGKGAHTRDVEVAAAPATSDGASSDNGAVADTKVAGKE